MSLETVSSCTTDYIKNMPNCRPSGCNRWDYLHHCIVNWGIYICNKILHVVKNLYVMGKNGCYFQNQRTKLSLGDIKYFKQQNHRRPVLLDYLTSKVCVNEVFLSVDNLLKIHTNWSALLTCRANLIWKR